MKRKSLPNRSNKLVLAIQISYLNKVTWQLQKDQTKLQQLGKGCILNLFSNMLSGHKNSSKQMPSSHLTVWSFCWLWLFLCYASTMKLTFFPHTKPISLPHRKTVHVAYLLSSTPIFWQVCNLPLHILPYNILLLKNNHRYWKQRAIAKFLHLTPLSLKGLEDSVKYSSNSGNDHSAMLQAICFP